MTQVKRTALVLGANGLIGELVVDILLKNVHYETVYAVSRKGIPTDNRKLVQILADTTNIVEKIKDIVVDDFYSCIGSTKAKTPDKEEYYKIDHDYPVLTAQILKQNGCQQIALVSSMGADPNAKNFYLKLKGDTEQSIINLGMQSTYIFRPGLIIGKRKEKRPLEALAQKLSPLLDGLLFGSLKNYRSIRAELIAKAMVNAVLAEKSGVHIYKTAEIKDLT